jgi:hypothetical protein
MAAALLAALTTSCSGDDQKAAFVSGTVRLRDGAPLPGVAVVFLGPATIAPASTPLAPLAPHSVIYENPLRAITDATGKYSLWAPSGAYSAWLGGTPDSGHMSVSVAQVVVGTGRLSLNLSYPGYRVSGRMIFLNGSLSAGTVSVIGPTSNTTAQLRENGAGRFAERTYSLLLPAGTYDFWADGTGYPQVPRVRFEGITVGADTVIDLPVNGNFVRGTVTAWNGSIVYGATVSATATGAFGYDVTTSIGTYGIHLPDGTYDFRVEPPPGADTLQVLTVPGVFINAPVTKDFTLLQAP